jgi:hypothetical protein
MRRGDGQQHAVYQSGFVCDGEGKTRFWFEWTKAPARRGGVVGDTTGPTASLKSRSKDVDSRVLSRSKVGGFRSKGALMSNTPVQHLTNIRSGRQDWTDHRGIRIVYNAWVPEPEAEHNPPAPEHAGVKWFTPKVCGMLLLRCLLPLGLDGFLRSEHRRIGNGFAVELPDVR